MDIAAVNYNDINKDSLILKSNFHLNYGKRRIDKARNKKFPFKDLIDCVKSIYKGGFDKNYFVNDPEFAYKYISGQDMTKRFPKDGCKLISKKLTKNHDEMLLKTNQILLSCAGTVGNVRYVDEDLEGIVGSQDMIRIETDDNKVLGGYIYAYLATKTCNEYIQSLVYGSVVPRIEPVAVGNLPIPIVNKNLQNLVDELILKASNLRVEANTQLEKMQLKINNILNDKYLDKKANYKIGKASIKQIKSLEKRMDSPYNFSTGRVINNKIKSGGYLELGEIADVEHPMLFGKKQLKGTEKKGNILYKSSSMMKLFPESDFWLSLKKIEKYRKLQVKEGDILISRTGTVGNVVMIYNHQNNYFIDDHMIRVKPKYDYSGIIYLFLKSDLGQELINFQKYGSVQEVINSTYIERIPLPEILLDKDFNSEINDTIELCSKKISLADEYEKEAITLIENEIESWQES